MRCNSCGELLKCLWPVRRDELNDYELVTTAEFCPVSTTCDNAACHRREILENTPNEVPVWCHMFEMQQQLYWQNLQVHLTNLAYI